MENPRDIKIAVFMHHLFLMKAVYTSENRDPWVAACLFQCSGLWGPDPRSTVARGEAERGAAASSTPLAASPR